MFDFFKIILCFIGIVVFYYFLNFKWFYFKSYEELDYYICFFIGLAPYILFKFLKEQTNDDTYEYAAKLNLLVAAVWYISYGVYVEHVILKTYAFALLLIIGVFLNVMTKNNWPYKTEEGLLFKMKNHTYCILLGSINWISMIIVVYILFIGEWGF